MSWQIEIVRDAREEFARLPSHMQARVSKAILALESNPFPLGGKKLKNRVGYRIRVSDYRVLYFADPAARQVVVGVIGHRRDVYRA